MVARPVPERGGSRTTESTCLLSNPPLAIGASGRCSQEPMIRSVRPLITYACFLSYKFLRASRDAPGEASTDNTAPSSSTPSAMNLENKPARSEEHTSELQ